MYEDLLERPLVYNMWLSIHFTPRFAAIKEVIETRPQPRLLDLGCGTGLLKRYFPACDYVGVDTNSKYIDYARKKLHGQFIVGDILELDTRGINTTFDYIILNGVLHHIDSATVAHLIKSAGRF